jgi:hypothetical protein
VHCGDDVITRRDALFDLDTRVIEVVPEGSQHLPETGMASIGSGEFDRVSRDNLDFDFRIDELQGCGLFASVPGFVQAPHDLHILRGHRLLSIAAAIWVR